MIFARIAVIAILREVRRTFAEDSARWCQHTRARTAAGTATTPFEGLADADMAPASWSLDGAVEAETFRHVCGTLGNGLEEAGSLHAAAISALSDVITPAGATPVATVQGLNDRHGATLDKIVATLDRAVERQEQELAREQAEHEARRKRQEMIAQLAATYEGL